MIIIIRTVVTIFNLKYFLRINLNSFGNNSLNTILPSN